MDIRKLQRAIVDGLEDVKAQNIVVFNTEHLSPLFERVIIATGASNRQTKSLASSVRETVKKRGMQVMRSEGEDNGEWIIVDCGAAVAHIMQPAIRTYYHLEEIWGDKPVRLKFGATKPVIAQAESEKAPAKAAKPKKKQAELGPSLRRSSAAKTAVKAAEQEARDAKAARGKPAAKKPAAKAGAAKRPITKVVAGKPAAKRAPAKKAAAKKTAPRKK